MSDTNWTEELARRLGFSKGAVIGKVNRLGLPARPSPIRGGQMPAPRATVVHPDRLAAGLAPLPAFHPLAMWRRS